MPRPPTSQQVQVNFRMPADLKARIEAFAEKNSRSTTAEIVDTLLRAYPAPSPLLSLGEFIEASRKAKPMSSDEFAAAIGKSVIALKHIERGKRNVSFTDIVKISEVLSIPVQDFVEAAKMDADAPKADRLGGFNTALGISSSDD